ncbi:unnamed protein product [Darwinula stevensoni]|uniref:Uncharacterized protein n=1 Tax=Darwinula stevensoni TaxID=69355 RepID=A0A7R9FS32_9CRUS|nr:unnamed protein product [Darwinula stevensoni]CAG0902463.1 unnamed protein product [Darwinula stevensoni]
MRIRRELSTSGGVVHSPRARPVEIPEITVWRFITKCIRERLAHRGDAVWLEDARTKRRYLYSEWETLVTRAGSALTRLGLAHGDAIFIHSWNHSEYFLVLHACAAIGVTVLNVPPYDFENLSRHVEHCRPALVVCSAQDSEKVSEAMRPCRNVPQVMTFDLVSGFMCVQDLLQDDGSAFPSDVDVDPRTHVPFVFYSSGTTGPPKPILRNHVATLGFVYNLLVDPRERLGERDEVILTPMNHCHMGGILFCLWGVYAGQTVVHFSDYRQDMLVPAILEYKPTSLTLFPKDVIHLCKSQDLESLDLSHVQRISVGGATLPGSMEKDLLRKIPSVKEFIQAYGSTEAGLCTGTDKPFHKIESVGVLAPFVQAKPAFAVQVLDVETGEVLGPNEEGELCFRTPCIMMGYLNNAKETAAVLDADGWYRSGDFGYYGEDGYFYVKDRVKDIIPVYLNSRIIHLRHARGTGSRSLPRFHADRDASGHPGRPPITRRQPPITRRQPPQVSPAEIENVLYDDPAVEQVGVAGVSIPGIECQVPRAFIVLKKSCKSLQDPPAEIDFIRLVEKKMSAAYHLTGGACFVSELVTSPAGKTYRKKLREMFEGELADGTLKAADFPLHSSASTGEFSHTVVRSA